MCGIYTFIIHLKYSNCSYLLKIFCLKNSIDAEMVRIHSIILLRCYTVLISLSTYRIAVTPSVRDYPRESHAFFNRYR